MRFNIREDMEGLQDEIKTNQIIKNTYEQPSQFTMHSTLPGLFAAISAIATTAQAQGHTMGFIGCSMAENVAQGYVAVGGQRMWGPYGTGGAVVQSWTDTNSASWQAFDQQAQTNGLPDTVWVQICIFAQAGASMEEVTRMIANAREHAAEGAEIIITGQPLYEGGRSCFLAGPGGAEHTDSLAQQAGADPSLNATYAGSFLLLSSEVADGCHANSAGQRSLGQQAINFWG